MNASDIVTLLMHRTVGIALAYLNCHMYILVGQLTPGSDLLVCL